MLLGTLEKACEKTAEDLQKDVRFEKGEINAAALKHAPRREIKEILTQLVRNSVAHGIESPESRTKAGKNATGTITISITEEGKNVRFVLKDDGAGLNYGKISEKALARKLITPADASNKAALTEVLFSPGFSTAENEGIHAGRGIGLNLVKEHIDAMHGAVTVRSAEGKGTEFSITIPLNAGKSKSESESKVSA
ncbi:MAG: hypothetical protein Ta2A_21580 [Treponemataceae bacterium]|nr:MAG: hypothetical protein Ta2A_21580 [Treponemataceae bacterium]